MAENISPCSVDTVPIQIILGTKQRPVTTLPDAQIIDFPPGFAIFVKTVTEHIAAKLAQDNLCLGSAESQEHSLLQFVQLGLDVMTPIASIPSLEAESHDVCRISSPWIDIVIERKPVPWIRAIVRYNERQLLADQAVLEGARNVPSGIALPLTVSEFDRYADLEYARTEIHYFRLRRLVTKPIEKRVPPDLLWLFRRAWQNPDSRFSSPALASMRQAMKIGADGYTKITTALIDRCFDPDGADIHYDNILDIDDLVLLEQYKIVTPIVALPMD